MKFELIDIYFIIIGEEFMFIHTEYAEILRIGEIRRDASDNIKGFLYQDLLAIELILDSLDDDRIYVEWVEDIFVENSTTVSIYQVKHYPRSELDFQAIFENMFYQLLKYKLYENDRKDVKTYCLYYADRIKNYDKVQTQKIINEIDFKTVNRPDIQNRLINCKSMTERIGLLFKEVANSSFLDELTFKPIEKNNIEITRFNLKNTLYGLFKASIETDEVIRMLDNETICDVLLALAVQYIQGSYYKKIEDYNERCMTKLNLINYIKRVFVADEQKNTEIIKSLVLGYIDEVFNEVIVEIEDKNNAEKYHELYLSTKEYLGRILGDMKTRFKFLNSISTEEHKVLNWEKYQANDFEEKNKYREHKNSIKLTIRMAWKVLYDIDCTDYGRYIKESDDCFFFDIENEEARRVVILSSTAGQSTNDMKKILPRVAKMKIRPDKWYMLGKLRKFYKYSYYVNKVDDVELSEESSVFYKEENKFKIECMGCVDYDGEKMEEKDPDLKECLFKMKCVKGE